MTGDEPKLFWIGKVTKQSGGALADVLVADAMKPVAAQPLGEPGARPRVYIRFRRQGGMKRCIEDGYVFSVIAQHMLRRFNGRQCKRVMKGREGLEFADARAHFAGKAGGFAEPIAAMNDAMAGDRNLIKAINDPVSAFDQAGENLFDGILERFDIQFDLS